MAEDVAAACQAIGQAPRRRANRLMDRAAAFVGEQEIHRAHDVEAVGAAVAAAIVVKISRHRPCAVHGVLAVLLEYQLRDMPSVLVVMHCSRRPEPFPVAVLGLLDQIGGFPHVTRLTKIAAIPVHGD
jgi:hypothetical protein